MPALPLDKTPFAGPDSCKNLTYSILRDLEINHIRFHTVRETDRRLSIRMDRDAKRILRDNMGVYMIWLNSSWYDDPKPFYTGKAGSDGEKGTSMLDRIQKAMRAIHDMESRGERHSAGKRMRDVHTSALLTSWAQEGRFSVSWITAGTIHSWFPTSEWPAFGRRSYITDVANAVKYMFRPEFNQDYSSKTMTIHAPSKRPVGNTLGKFIKNG